LLKSREEIELMRVANGIVAEVLAEVRSHVRAGVTTAELDALAEELTRKRGARAAFKGYTVGGRMFRPRSISINDEVAAPLAAGARRRHRRPRLRRLLPATSATPP
jgi:methionyl aminopeptidase